MRYSKDLGERMSNGRENEMEGGGRREEKLSDVILVSSGRTHCMGENNEGRF